MLRNMLWLFLLLLHCASTVECRYVASTQETALSAPSAPHDAMHWDWLAPTTSGTAHIIAVLRSKELITSRFRHVCAGSTHPKGKHNANSDADSISDKLDIDGLPHSCWKLQGACHRVFSSTLAGVAGHFTRQQLAALQDCAGVKGIIYLTRDDKVKKTEGDGHPRWWLHRAPQNMTIEQLQQQLAASKLGAAAAVGVASSTTNPLNHGSRTGSSHQSPRVQASAGAQHSHVSNNATRFTMAVVQRWLMAELGLAAQKELMHSSLQPVLVRAADRAPEHGVRPVVTADATDTPQEQASGSNQPRGSKNQDPGIPVDPHAVGRPDIIVRTSGDASSTRSAATESLQQPLSLDAAEKANKEPGIKEQRLVTALWNLDRVDQKALPLNSTYSYGSRLTPGTGKGVTIYVLDSGIRPTHQEFQPWDGSGGSRAEMGPDFVDDDGLAEDSCEGHGTHVASTAAGRSVGIAKEARVVAVRVLDCEGAGSISNVVAALDWVAQHAVKPAVVSLSLGVPAGNWSRPMEDAIQHMTDVVGIPVIVASGNSAKDSCEVAPARAPTVITVAASNLPTKFAKTQAGDVEDLYSWSNTGACVKLFAPGVDIYGACGAPSRCAVLNDSSYTWASGTSMAAPHVTGAVAVYLESNPTATPKEVLAALVAASSTGRLTDSDMLPGTPNRLLFTASQQ